MFGIIELIKSVTYRVTSLLLCLTLYLYTDYDDCSHHNLVSLPLNINYKNTDGWYFLPTGWLAGGQTLTHLEMVCSEQDLPALPAQVWSPGTEEVRLAGVPGWSQRPGPDGRDVAGRHHGGRPRGGRSGAGDDGAQWTHAESLVERSPSTTTTTVGQYCLSERTQS